MRVSSRVLVRLVAALAGAVPAAAVAQDSVATHDRGWLTAFSVGVPGLGDEAFPDLFTLGAQFTRVRHARPGADLAFGVLPRALEYGLLAIGLRGGLGLPLVVGRSLTIIPSAGVSAVVAMAAGEGGGIAGAQAGLAAQLGARRGLRVGMTWHQFGEGRIWLLEVGIARLSR